MQRKGFTLVKKIGDSSRYSRARTSFSPITSPTGEDSDFIQDAQCKIKSLKKQKLTTKPHYPVKWRLVATKTLKAGFAREVGSNRPSIEWCQTGPPPNTAELNPSLSSIGRRW
jgi:hypothetical protein